MNSGLLMLLFCKLDLLFYMFYNIELKWFNLRNSWVNFLQNFFIGQPPRPHPGNTNWRRGLSTVELLIKVPCFVKKQILFALWKGADLNLLVRGGQLYRAFLLIRILRLSPWNFFGLYSPKLTNFFTALNGSTHF